jgi:TonB family protein
MPSGPLKSRPSVLSGALLPEQQKRWGSFGAGFVLEMLVLAIVVIVPLLMPQKFELATHYWVTPVAAPVIQPWKPQPPPKPVVMKREIVKEIPKPTPQPVVVPKPQIFNPVIAAPVVKRVLPKEVRAPELAKLNPDVSLGSSAVPTLKRPREEVQTGGFGDPNSVPDNGKRNANPNMVQMGGYDMPQGAGVGNGTGGAKGAKGVVASSGFGNGVAVGGTGGGPRGGVQQGAFADQAVAAPAAKKQATVASNTKPVEILEVPKPAYTDAARNMKIEGDVLLQVVFSASGEVKVERVVRGLGYGLDETAEAAARQIRFKPAQQGGQPVDSPAVVHITFELAY